MLGHLHKSHVDVLHWLTSAWEGFFSGDVRPSHSILQGSEDHPGNGTHPSSPTRAPPPRMLACANMERTLWPTTRFIDVSCRRTIRHYVLLVLSILPQAFSTNQALAKLQPGGEYLENREEGVSSLCKGPNSALGCRVQNPFPGNSPDPLTVPSYCGPKPQEKMDPQDAMILKDSSLVGLSHSDRAVTVGAVNIMVRTICCRVEKRQAVLTASSRYCIMMWLP